jgi:hypothetical protein
MTDPSDLQRTLDRLVDRLVEFSGFPKYSLERRVDIFLVPFLERFVEGQLRRTRPGVEARLVAPEFPILADLREHGPHARTPSGPRPRGEQRRGELTRRTVNVDYLFRLTGGGAPEWLFVELKTDARSFDDEQADLYAIARARGMARLRADIAFVLEKTAQQGKYVTVQGVLPDADARVGDIRVAYLAPIALRETARAHRFPRTPAQRDRFPDLREVPTIDDFFALEDLAAWTADAFAPAYAPLWPTVQRLLRALLPPGSTPPA